MKKKYLYLEKVKISSKIPLKRLRGCNGTILGYDFVDGKWIYSVDIESKVEIYSISEEFLISNSDYDLHENFY